MMQNIVEYYYSVCVLHFVFEKLKRDNLNLLLILLYSQNDKFSMLVQLLIFFSFIPIF